MARTRFLAVHLGNHCWAVGRVSVGKRVPNDPPRPVAEGLHFLSDVPFSPRVRFVPVVAVWAPITKTTPLSLSK
jgi:hypothetical protein